MDKGYYLNYRNIMRIVNWSQSTIKMDKGYYLPLTESQQAFIACRNPQ